MFDHTVNEVLFHLVTKFAVALVLVVLWYTWYRTGVVAWKRRSAEFESGASKIAPSFPMAGLVVMLFLTGGFFLYASFEQAFRPTNRIHRPQNEGQIQGESGPAAQSSPSTESPDEAFARKSREKLEELNRQNEAAKKRFLELTPVESNGTGGAKPKTPTEADKGNK